MGSFNQRGELEYADGLIIVCSGKKKSGKSIMGLTIFRAYPQDRVVLDVAGDDGPVAPEIINLTGDVETLPKSWPEYRREEIRGVPQPMTLRYIPDPGSPTFHEDMDAVIGLAMSHGDCAVLVHEMGVLGKIGKVGPHTLRLLMHNRHRHVTLIACMPRPKNVDPLVIGQADLIYIFDTPQGMDRARIAENIGWETADLDAAHEDLGRHEYLRFDANEEKPEEGEPDYRLVHFPALPLDVVRATKQWAQGHPLPDEVDESAPRRRTSPRSRMASGTAR